MSVTTRNTAQALTAVNLRSQVWSPIQRPASVKSRLSCRMVGCWVNSGRHLESCSVAGSGPFEMELHPQQSNQKVRASGSSLRSTSLVLEAWELLCCNPARIGWASGIGRRGPQSRDRWRPGVTRLKTSQKTLSNTRLWGVHMQDTALREGRLVSIAHIKDGDTRLWEVKQH